MSFGVVIFTRNNSRWSDLRELVQRECALPSTHCESWDEFAHFVSTTPVAGCILDYDLGRAQHTNRVAQSEFKHLTHWANAHPEIPLLILTPEPELAAEVHPQVFWKKYIDRDPSMLAEFVGPLKDRVRETLRNLSLVNLESALNSAATSAIVVARSLNATQEMARFREAGPLDPMTTAVTSDEQVNVDDLREVIQTLQAVSAPLDPRKPRIAVIGHDPPLVSALHAQKGIQVLHMRGLSGMPILRERFLPHLIVLVERDPELTKQILLELHLARGLLQPYIILLAQPQDFTNHFASLEISEMLDASLPPLELVSYLIDVARRRLLHSPRIAVVDDDGQLENLARFIAGLGIDVRVNSNPLMTLEPEEREAFDVFIIKRSYRKLSGLDLCRSLHESAGMLRAPIVMVLDESREDIRAEAFQHGADEVLTMPFGPAESRVRLQTLLANHAMRRRLSRLDELTGANHWSALTPSLSEHLQKTRQDNQWTSLVVLEIVGFDAILRKHGISTCRTLLRHVSDHLAQNVSASGVFRSWRDRFIVIAERPLLEDELEARLNAIRSVTFRDHEGRGFYVKLRGGHLKIPPSAIPARACVKALMRILERTNSDDHILTAELDPDSFPSAPSDAFRESQRNNGWYSVVLTSQNE